MFSIVSCITQFSLLSSNIMVAPPFYNALYGINYRLLNVVTYIIVVAIYSVVGVVYWRSNHNIAFCHVGLC